jgi:hypothetical protein
VREFLRELMIKDPLRLLVGKRLDHGLIIVHGDNIVKRYYWGDQKGRYPTRIFEIDFKKKRGV